MTQDIRPRFDEHGVAWCSMRQCPHYEVLPHPECCRTPGCTISNRGCAQYDICEPWAREAARVLKAIEPFAEVARNIPAHWQAECPLRIDSGTEATGRYHEWLSYYGVDGEGKPIGCDALLPTIGQWRELIQGDKPKEGQSDG